MARLLAAFLALAVGFVGAVPAAAHRCLRMEQVMAHACCAASADEADSAIGEPCCELLRAPIAEARIAPRDAGTDLQIAPAPFAGILTFGSPSSAILALACQPAEAAAVPTPGGRAHTFSPVLRI